MRWFLLSLALIVGVVHSQEPVPSPAKASEPPKAQAKSGKQRAKAEQRGSKNAPLFVEGHVTTTKSKADAERDAEEGKDKSANDHLVMVFTGLTALFTFALSSIAGFQLWMFYRQLKLMREGADDAKNLAGAAKLNAENSKKAVETMQNVANTQLRAFVFPVSIFSLWEQIPETTLYGWRFRPQWQNSGATPTKNLTIHAWGELRDTVLPDDFNFSYATNDIGNGLIPPRLTLQGGVVPQNLRPVISPQDIIDMQAGTKLLYIWGWARYNDVFPGTPQHITRFCWVITPVGNPMTFQPNSTNPGEQLNFAYLYHQHGNCADEECG
jgi:hypothetical protein